MSVIESGDINGVEYEIHDFSATLVPGLTSGFYYTAGNHEGETEAERSLEILEGPFATLQEAHVAVDLFINGALEEAQPTEE